ncbi:MAG: hypothetical protein Q4C01_02220 [Clostridia bacterium]|nr:hypothetical protein [Clostridia bacterium]
MLILLLAISLMLSGCRTEADEDAEPAFAPATFETVGVCGVEGCQNPIWRSGHSYCEEHICMYGDCDNPRMDADTRYCEEHAYVELLTPRPELCAVTDCTEYAEWGDYCKQHVCKFGTCKNPRAEGSEYCEEHGKEDEE